jgi:hypothetical protein
MRNGAVAALLVVAILAGAGGGYLIGNAGERTATKTSTFSSLSTTTTTINETIPMDFSYLTTVQGCATNGRYVPCLGSPAYVFNSCLNMSWPATPHTCTYTLREFFPGHPSYTFNITLGYVGQPGEAGWANCVVSDGIGVAFCLPVINGTAFVVGQPAPPPQ